MYSSRFCTGNNFFHFKRRLKWIYDPLGDGVDGQRELGLVQTLVRHIIFNKWTLYSRPDDYGCAITWLNHAIKVSCPLYHSQLCSIGCCQDSRTNAAVQLYFGLQHTLLHRCPEGHVSRVVASNPESMFQFNDHDLRITRAVHGSHITMTDYFQHLIPRRRIGNDANGTTVLHTLPSSTCLHSNCKVQADLMAIETSWPQILQIIPESRAASEDMLKTQKWIQLDRKFTIPDQKGNGVEYQLVGRVCFHSNQHFTSDIMLENRLFLYNDMFNKGKLVDIGDSTLFDTQDDRCVLLTYHRTSSLGKVRTRVPE